MVVLVCPKCEYAKEGLEGGVELKVPKGIRAKERQSVTVISKEDQKMQTLATIKVECPECGHTFREYS